MTVTVLLVADGRRVTSHASTSPATVVPMGTPEWQSRLADVPASRAREGVVRPEADIASQGAARGRRFIPLAAVVPTARATY